MTHFCEDRANEKQQKPDSWRGCLYSNLLSYPRFLTLFIEWLRFLVSVRWLVKKRIETHTLYLPLSLPSALPEGWGPREHKIYIACLIYRENITGNLFSMIRNSPHLNRFQFDVTTSLWLTRGPSLTSCRFLYHSFFDGCMYLYTAHVTYHVSWRFTNLFGVRSTGPLASCLKIVDKLNTGWQRLFSWAVQTWFVV